LWPGPASCTPSEVSLYEWDERRTLLVHSPTAVSADAEMRRGPAAAAGSGGSGCRFRTLACAIPARRDASRLQGCRDDCPVRPSICGRASESHPRKYGRAWFLLRPGWPFLPRFCVVSRGPSGSSSSRPFEVSSLGGWSATSRLSLPEYPMFIGSSMKGYGSRDHECHVISVINGINASRRRDWRRNCSGPLAFRSALPFQQSE
jgi:hypothetical protein